MKQDRVIFVHVPKCGGGTLYNLIEEKTFKDNLHRKMMKNKLSPVDRATILDKEFTRSPLNFGNNKVIFGHFHYSTYHSDHSKNMITIIRNPIDRTISHYYEWLNKGHFNKGNRPAHIRREMKLMKDDIVYFTKKFKNFMTRYFTGEDVSLYNYIGFLEDYNNSLKYINDNYFKVNLNSIDNIILHKSDKKKISEKTKQLMSEYLTKDLKFYEDGLCQNL